jgi:cytochrome c
MRLSPTIVTAVLLAVGAWGAASASPDLQFTDPAPAMPEGDAMRGAEVYEASCTGCHSLDANRVGPAHRGVVGRIAGTAPMFNYSLALKATGLTWTPENINTWLINPQAFVKGVRMGFRLSDAQKRADVIAYLAAEGRKKTP